MPVPSRVRDASRVLIEVGKAMASDSRAAMVGSAALAVLGATAASAVVVFLWRRGPKDGAAPDASPVVLLDFQLAIGDAASLEEDATVAASLHAVLWCVCKVCSLH
jgi:hypothetical protein